MNGAATDFIEENGHGSDSDANSDVAPEYYQPISAVDDEEDGGSSDGEHDIEFRQLPNGVVENGISSLHLNDGVEQKSSDEEEEEEEEEERSREELEWAIRRALREDENRRNAPLTAENATRVMQAMRGVSFAGEVPQWASQVPQDRWIDQLRRLRQSPNT